MILNDEAIRCELDNGLVITDNDVDKANIYEQINPNSLDLTICSKYKKPLMNTNPLTYGKPYDEKSYWRDADDQNIELRPGQVILACTNEYLKIPPHLAANVYTKSSLARCFINHMLAGVIDAGFEGRITLELRNDGMHTIVIPANSRVVQIELFDLTAPAAIPYNMRKNRYNKSEKTICSRPENWGEEEALSEEKQNFIRVRRGMLNKQKSLDQRYWTGQRKYACPKCNKAKGVNFSCFTEDAEDDYVNVSYEVSCSSCGFSYHEKHNTLRNALRAWNGETDTDGEKEK